MRVSREQAAENRERVVRSAARLFRERGFEGVAVADLMREAGLTHGGFYGQFESKEALMGEAVAQAFEESVRHWRKAAERGAQDGGMQAIEALLQAYLSPLHRDTPGQGCVIAAMGSEAARQPLAVRVPLTAGIRRLLDRLSHWTRGRSEATRRQRAITTLSAMVGAIQLARVVDDEALSQEILAATREGLAQLGR